MSGPAAPMQFMPTLPPEEAARANFYALLGRLFYAPPDEALLQAIAGEDEIDSAEGALGLAWRDLATAAAGTSAASAREEYDAAFIGTGKAPVTLYTSAYSVRYTNEAPLAELRGTLAALGLGRHLEANEPEDHIAALCEVMRHLIAEQKGGLPEQRQFFERWIWPTAGPLCSAIEQSEQTRFYKSVAGLLLEVCTFEHRAFEML